MGSEMCIRDRLINTADTPLRYQLRLALLARIEAFPNSCRGIHAGVSIELVVEGAWRGHVGPACTGVKGSELCLPCTVWRAATVSEGLLSIPYSFFFVPPDGYRRNARRRTRISLEAIPSRPLRVGPCPRRPYSPHARRRGPSSGVDATQVGRRRQTFFLCRWVCRSWRSGCRRLSSPPQWMHCSLCEMSRDQSFLYLEP